MQIDVKLFSSLRSRLPREARGAATVELAEGATIAVLLAHLGLESSEAEGSSAGPASPIKLVTVNGQRETDLRRPLSDGDTVLIFPPVVGG